MRKLDFAIALGKDTGGDTSADTVIAEPEFIYSRQAINKKCPGEISEAFSLQPPISMCLI